MIKKYVFLIFLHFLAFMNTSAQPLIEKLKSILPSGWEIRPGENQYVIAKLEKVWLYNGINMQAFRDEKELETYVKSIGHQSELWISVKYEISKGNAEYKKIQKVNQMLDLEISKLAVDTKVQDLPHKFDSYIASTPAEEKRLKRYEEGKEKFESQKVRVPDFEAEGYAFYIDENQGMTQMVFPAEAGSESFLFKGKIVALAETRY